YVAAGIFDGFWERNLSSWDICAGIALVREAGGKVSSYDGGPVTLDGKELLATNGKIHGEMMKILSGK
ncbi:MAG: inositol monophosphatase family protein, partial [Bdellovibrionota bacterium]